MAQTNVQAFSGDVEIAGNLSVPSGITGVASSATKLETARTIGGVSFDGTGDINLPGVNTAGTQNTSGNAGTATALETARTIGGVSFNGTANIDLPGVNTQGTQDTSGNASTATTLATARNINGTSFDGSSDILVEPYISDDNTGDPSCYLVFTHNTTAGYKRLYEDAGLTYNNTNNEIGLSSILLGDYIYHSGDTNTYFGFSTNDHFIVGTSGSTAMTIDSSRHVGIGVNANGYLSVRGNYTNSSAPTTYNSAPPLCVVNPTNADEQPVCQFRTNQGVTNVRNDGIFHKRGNGDVLQLWTSSGHCRFGNGTRGKLVSFNTNGDANFNCPLKANSYNNNSDDRVKHNESYIKDAIQTLFKLKPQIYDKSDFENDVLEHQQYLNATDKDGYEWNDVEDAWIRRKPVSSGTIKREAGLIAQDVWYDAPELRHIVTVAADANPDDTKPQEPEPGNIRNDPDYDSAGWGKIGPATVNYISLIPYIIKSIKELYNEVTRHKTRVPSKLYTNVQDYHHMIVSKRGDNIHLANTESDKAVHGVISNIKTDTDNYELLIEHTGMGNVWVINTGTNIESGDYITTSNVTGYGMLQGSGAFMNHTLGKSTIDCDFTVQTTPIKQKIRRLQDKTYWIKVEQLIDCSFMAYSNLADDVRTTKIETYYNVYENRYTTSNIEDITMQYVLDNETPFEVAESDMNFEQYSNTYAFNTPFYTGPLTRTKYYRKQISKLENEMEGYEPIVEQEMMDVLDDNGQVQWEDTGDTKPLYELRYLTNDGSITDQSNAVYTASLIPVSLHL